MSITVGDGFTSLEAVDLPLGDRQPRGATHEDREAFRSELSRFAQLHWTDQHLREHADGGSEASRRALDTFEREMSIHGILVPERHGGLGGSCLDAVTAAEQLGAAMLPSNLLGACTAAVLLGRATGGLQDELLPLVPGRGARTAVIWPGADASWSADSGYQMAAADTRVQARVDFVPDAIGANIFVLPVIAGGEVGIAAVELAAASDVVVVDEITSTDALRPLATVTATLPGRSIVPLERGRETVAMSLALAAVILAAEMVGAAQACLDRTVQYAKVRNAFGRPIATFQVIKHRLVDAVTAVEAARALTHRAAAEVERALAADPGNGGPAMTAARMSKASASDALGLVAKESIQVHGAMGFTWDHPTHFYLKKWMGSSRLYGQPGELRRLVYQATIARSTADSARPDLDGSPAVEPQLRPARARLRQ